MNKIVIVGAGQLGSRHLQGLARINLPSEIYVVEPNNENRERSTERYNEIPRNVNISKYSPLESIEQLPDEIDLAIISTNADIRAAVTDKLILNKKVRYILFEKVLFQNPNDYFRIEELLHQKGIKAWVNCPRRTFSIYKEIKDFFGGEKVNLFLQGGNWGLGCNAMHFIDTMAFVNNSKISLLNSDMLDKDVIESKRKGYIEFTGKLIGLTENGAELIFQSDRTSIIPPIVIFYNDTKRVVVQEYQKRAIFYSHENHWEPKELIFDFPFQSMLTNIFAESILSGGECQLVSYQESAQLHLKMINSFVSHLHKNTSININHCPIT